MYQNPLPTVPHLFDVNTDLLKELCIQILWGSIVDIDTIACEAFFLRKNKKRNVQDLDYNGYVEGTKGIDRSPYDCWKGANVQTAHGIWAKGTWLGWEDVVKGSVYCNLDLRW
jgi:hypothetical protein